jgi:GLPGLI family protein
LVNKNTKLLRGNNDNNYICSMKKIIFALFIIVSASATAQKVIDKAIVKIQTNITFPESNQTAGDSQERQSWMRDMEINATVFFKGDNTKVESATDFGTTLMYMDRKAHKSTTLMEMMGKKTGFYTIDGDNAKADSIRNLRRDSLQKMGITFASSEPVITYTEETKKIAGFACKKAIIKTKGRNNEVTESAVWYCPEFKMGPGFATSAGGGGPMRSMQGGMQGLDKINGFPMEYEMVRSNGMKMQMQVTKVQLDANIEDKLFEIPKGYDIKSMADFQQQGGRMFSRGGGND